MRRLGAARGEQFTKDTARTAALARPTGQDAYVTSPEEVPAPTWKRALGAGALLVGLGHATRTARLLDEPIVVRSDANRSALGARALELAKSGADENGAVRELRAQAGRHRRWLLDAAAHFRMGGGAREIRSWNQANRLLLRAADVPVEPLSADEERLPAWAEGFVTLPPEQAFAWLVEREPQLLALRDTLPTEAERANAGVMSVDEDDPIFDRVEKGLRPLIGPHARTADPLLRSNTAHGAASHYLLVRAGLRVDEEAAAEARRMLYGDPPTP
jgi:hypothetical protein